MKVTQESKTKIGMPVIGFGTYQVSCNGGFLFECCATMQKDNHITQCIFTVSERFKSQTFFLVLKIKNRCLRMKRKTVFMKP